MPLFCKKTKYTKLNTLIVNLEKHSAELLNLGRSVFGDIEEANKIKAYATQRPVDSSSGTQFPIEKQLAEEYARNKELLEKLSADYDRVQYLITLLRFVARNYASFKKPEGYVNEPSLVFTLGEHAKTQAVLEDIIDSFAEDDFKYLRDSAEKLANRQGSSENLVGAAIREEHFVPKENQGNSSIRQVISTTFSRLMFRIDSQEDESHVWREVSDADSSYAARNYTYMQMDAF